MTTPPPPKRPPGRGPAPWFNYASASSVGIEIVVVFLMFTLGAYWLERNVTHWSPWTAMIGMGFGMFASTMVIARLIREHNAAMAAKAQAEAEVDSDQATTPDNPSTPPTANVPAEESDSTDSMTALLRAHLPGGKHYQSTDDAEDDNPSGSKAEHRAIETEPRPARTTRTDRADQRGDEPAKASPGPGDLADDRTRGS